jgi:hypothetical protein
LVAVGVFYELADGLVGGFQHRVVVVVADVVHQVCPEVSGQALFAEGSRQALLELHLVRELSGALPEASSPGLCGQHT